MSISKIVPANRTQQVVAQLTQSILNGEIEKGSHLPPERELAEQMGVSRTVVREGTKILHSSGLVTVRHGTGTVVNGLTTEPVRQVLSHALSGEKDRLEQLLEARLGLEVKIASLAAERATPEEIGRMNALLEEFENNMADLPECARLDVAFHEALARSTRNPIFLVMLEPLTDLLKDTRLRSLSLSHPRVALGHHREILQAVTKKQSQRAAQAMEHHLSTAIAELRENRHQ